MMVTVPSSVSSVVISLVTDKQYIIEVSAISIVNGISVSGYRTSYSQLTISEYSSQILGTTSKFA